MSTKSKFPLVPVIVFIAFLIIAALFRSDPEPVEPLPVPEPGIGQRTDAIAVISENRNADAGINESGVNELKELLQQETRNRLLLEERVEEMNQKLEKLEAAVISLSSDP